MHWAASVHRSARAQGEGAANGHLLLFVACASHFTVNCEECETFMNPS